MNSARTGTVVVVPEWVADKLEEWQKDRKSGTVSLNFSDGAVRNIEEKHVIHPPKQQ